MPHSVMLFERHPLDAFFAPRNIAVIGATEKAGSVGLAAFSNLRASDFGGKVIPVNTKSPQVLGVPAYRSVKDIPDAIDLAVIITPAPTIPAIVRECGEKGVRAAIVISAGFKETGPAGVELEKQLLTAAQTAGIRIIGPNCLGVMSPPTGVNATFAQAMARPGKNVLGKKNII